MVRKRRHSAAAVRDALIATTSAANDPLVSPALLSGCSVSDSTTRKENVSGCDFPTRRTPDPESRCSSPTPNSPLGHLHLIRGCSGSSGCEGRWMGGLRDSSSSLTRLHGVASFGARPTIRAKDKSPPLGDGPSLPSGGGNISITATQNTLYSQHWSQVVLGATSAIVFVLVLSICYALYVLIAPYGQSIVNGVLLSIVMHPQSRLRSALYMGAAVDRMTEVQQRWAMRGRLMGLIGSWLSLLHFASFVIMQGTFFLGLNKIHVHTQSILLKGVLVDRPDVERDAQDPGAALPSIHQSQGLAKPPPKSDLAREQRGGVRGRPNCTTASVSLAASLGGFPATAVSYSPCRQRLVTTPRGRRILRWLTVTIVVSLAHLLIGFTYFVLLHIVLGLTFATTVLFMPTKKFVMSMGRLWRVSVILFFVVGLALNATADVLSISEAVRRTTSAVVSGGSGAEVAMGALSSSNTSNVLISPFTVEHGCLSGPDAEVSDTAGASPGGVDEGTEKEAAPTGSAGVDSLSVLSQHRSQIEAFVVGKIQDFVLQELADIVSDGNVSRMVDTLTFVLPPQLRSVVTRGGAVFADGGLTADKDGAAPLGSGERDSLENLVAKSSLWSTIFVYARTLHPATAIMSLIYDFLPDTSAATRNDTGISGLPAASHKLRIDWIAVFRLIASRLLPYVEFAARVFFRVGANLLGFFDSVYAVMLFVFFYRYLTQLKYTVLYYGLAKLLRVMQPDVGDHHARSIEQDITVSCITLLESFWHLTWFHFCITFSVFRMWGFPIPFFLGLVSVVLALFPLVPKWLSPCSIALVYMLVQLALLISGEDTNISDPHEPGEAFSAAATVDPFLFFPLSRSWTEVLVWGKPYVFHYTRVLCFGLAVLLESGDEWLLCVSRGLSGSVVAHAPGNRGEPLQPFVIGTSLVLGFVAYGTRGIVLGPLTVIVARVFFDNWDIILSHREHGRLPLPMPSLPGLSGEGGAQESSFAEH